MKTTKFALAGALGLIALVAPPAYADTITTYTINFTTTSGSPAPTSGSFTFNSTTPSFTAFTVGWDGSVFDLAASANSPFTANGIPTGCTGESATPAYGFALITKNLTGCTATYQWQVESGASTTTAGTTTFNAFFFLAEVPGKSLDGIDATTSPAHPGVIFLPGGSWTVEPVPESSSIYLLGTGLLCLLGMRLLRKGFA